MLAVFRRELKAYFTSPIGFVFVGFFILIAGVFFALSNLLSGNPTFTGVLSNLTFIFLFLVPILTMRLHLRGNAPEDGSAPHHEPPVHHGHRDRASTSRPWACSSSRSSSPCSSR